MKCLKQLLIILFFSVAGQALQKWIPLPVPAAIYGFVLLLATLCSGLLKESHIHETADFLIRIMPIFFVAPAVNILSDYQLIAENWIPIVTIILISTFAVFAVAGLVTQLLHRKEDGKND